MLATEKRRMNQLHIIRGSDINVRDNLFEVDRRHYRFLAQSDSWFSIGSVPLAPVGNVLTEMRFSNSAIAVNCARPTRCTFPTSWTA